MKVIYVAGPYRAENAWHVEKNVRRAEKIGYQIALAGASAIVPHAMSRFLNGTVTEDYWIKATMELLRRADAVYMCEGWKLSTGSVAERDEALALGLPVIYKLSQLWEYLEQKEKDDGPITL